MNLLRLIPSYLPSIYVLIAVGVVALFADTQRQSLEMQHERETVRVRVSALRTRLQSRISRPNQLVQPLLDAITYEPDMTQQRFSFLADRIISADDSLRNLAGARDLVVNLVHPYEPNKSALGLDYNTNDAQRDAAYRVRDTGEFVLSGPVDLVQGGRGFIGRFPVYSHASDKVVFWGLLSVVMDVDKFYDQVGLNDPDRLLDVTLVGTDGRGAAGGTFLGDPAMRWDNPVSTDVLFHNGSWVLHARPIGGWGSTVVLWRWRILLTLSALTIALTTLLANYLANLRQTSILALRSREIELEEARQKLEHLALHDHLTGLPNRRFLDKTLAELGRQKTPFPGLMQMDLNGFKEVNDLSGHAAGDVLLEQVAQRFRAALGPDDFLARVGGDEFVVVCRPSVVDIDGSRDRLEATACKMIKCFELPFTSDAKKRWLAMSAGIYQHRDGEHVPQDWLALADRAMYRAKQTGRNRYEFAGEGPEPDNRVNQTRSGPLLDALTAGQIVPFYQPQFGKDGTTIVGVEALARWNHPNDGLLDPGAFMPIARNLKIESEIDQLIFEQAVHDLERCDKAGLTLPRVSVNVSFRRLNDPRLIPSISALKMDAKRVSLELLESVFLDDRNVQMNENIKALRAQGFDIEIDDFGTGFSSITSLLKLRPHRLKIERTLVQGAAISTENRHLLATIVEMGRALNIDVCAEGIETAEHLRIAQAVGCNVLQGFVLARPMRIDKLIEFLKTHEAAQLFARSVER